MRELAVQIEATSACVRSAWSLQPRVGIILGTGLGGFSQTITDQVTIPYREVPHFPESTALGHRGALVCGTLGPVPVIAMDGRFHLYEGYTPQAATLPIRMMKHLGVQLLIISNAAGGLNPRYASGDVMLIEDQINLTWKNPLWGKNDDRLGPRFPDMSSPFRRDLIDVAMSIARVERFDCHRGVYAALTGPTYETRAEYRMLRTLGADVVGMSTVHEVLVAAHTGLDVVGISAVTNLCRPDTLESTSGAEVKSAAERAEPKMRSIVNGLVAAIHS